MWAFKNKILPSLEFKSGYITAFQREPLAVPRKFSKMSRGVVAARRVPGTRMSTSTRHPTSHSLNLALVMTE